MPLCEYCSAIEFEMLRCPTIEELISLNTKAGVPDCYPFKSSSHKRDRPKFSLGLHYRVRQSSSECPFCSAICDIVSDQKDNRMRDLDSFECVASIVACARVVPVKAMAWGPECEFMHLYRIDLIWYPIGEGEKTDQPGIRTDTETFPWYFINDAFQTYDAEVSDDGTSSRKGNQKVAVFSGRLRPKIIDIKRPAQWLKECQDNHAECSNSKLPGQAYTRKVFIQIGKMGSIYAHSKVTLIAASGRSAEAGLPGFETCRTGKQTQVLISRVDSQFSMKLMRTLNPHNNGFSFSHQLDGAEWSRRGWTLQERALARRSIIFTDEQLIWACKKCHRTEETYCETSLAHTSWFRLQETECFLDTSLRSFFASDDVIEQTWYRFRLLVFDFTKRQLTKPGDAHDAFHAILEQVKQLTGDTFLWGLPTTNFEMGLCWEPGSLLGVRRRKDLTVLKATSLDRRVPFPSWSWLGWHNAISIRVEERYRDLGMDPEIICYVLRNSPLRLVRVPRISSDVPGGHIHFHPLQSQQSSPNAISLEDIPKHFPELGIKKLDDTPDDQLIFFWAEVAQFEVSEILTVKHEIPKNTPWEPRYTHKHRDIKDMNGNVVAQTAYCYFEETTWEDETSCRAEPDAGSGTFDFVLIANSNPPDPESQPSKIVLQVERKNGVMYRVNNAEIPEEVWKRSDAKRMMVALGTPDDPATPENDKEARAGIEDIPRIPEDGEQGTSADVPQIPVEAELENQVAEDSIQPVENADPEQRSRGRLSGRTLRANRQKQPEGLPPIILPDWFWNNVKLVEELPQIGSLAVYYGGNVPEFVESSLGPEATEKMSHAIKSIVECDLPPTEKARYSMHVDVYKEILASIRAGLKLRPSQAVLDDSVVETISTKLGADLIRLDPVDIAQILGPYIDENLAWTGSKASLLGYETSRMAGRLEDYEKDSSTVPEDIEGVEEEELAGMSKKAGPAIAFTASNSSEAQKKLSAIFSRLKGALTPAAENNRRSSDVVMPFATFADPNFSASSNANSSFGNVKSNAEQWNDLKTTALLESLVAGADSKRASESSGADATNTKDLIIQVRDYKDLTRTYDGYNIIDKLRTVVTKRWQSGRNIIMVGTSSLEQGESELSSAGIQHLQSDIVEVFESDDKLRIRNLNIRHVEDMITKLSGDTPVTVDIEKDLDVAWVVSAGLDDAVWHYARVQRLATTILGLESNPEIIDGPTFWKAQQLLSENNDVNKMLDEINASPKKTDIKEKLKQIRKTCTPHEKKLLGGVVIPSDIHTKFEDVHAPKETVEALKTLTSLSLIRPEAFTYGVLATDKMPGLLLYGPPGTGKTLLAKAVAKESGATVLEISGAEVNDMYVGEGEKNVRAIFSLAKKLSPCVVFIDEADAIFAARGDTKRSTAHREMINQFLREWDGMNDLSAFIMVATNRPFDLDEAVLRRLPRRLLVDLPVEKDRESILKIHLKDEVIDPSVSLAELAKNTPFYSGSDLKNLSVAAALACIREENELATKHEGDTPYTYPEKRILTKQHFDKAMEEISASISEDMSTLSAIRKFDEKYGDRKGRRKKSAGLGFGGTSVPEKDSEAGRVRKSPVAA
ncbi:Mus7/MMS22 family protein (ATPase) [Botrytis cinerea]